MAEKKLSAEDVRVGAAPAWDGLSASRRATAVVTLVSHFLTSTGTRLLGTASDFNGAAARGGGGYRNTVTTRLAG
jgi:hypothetical protein